MGLDFDELFPSRFLKAGELKGQDVTLTITLVEREGFEKEGGKGAKELKCILGFKERPEKQLVCNKTNALCIRAMFGRDSGEWIGKRVTFFPAAVDYMDSDIAIRVRGSPDIPSDMNFELKLARKKPRMVRLVRTGARAAAKPKNGHAPVPSAGEPPEDVLLAGQEPPFPSDADAPGGV